MVRKQLYITATHEEALKAEARATGATEADIVRAALDVAFGHVKGRSAIDAGILDDFKRTAIEFRNRERPLGPKVYDRASIYQRFVRRLS